MTEKTRTHALTLVKPDPMLGLSLSTYADRKGRAALRSALGDAAGLCDRIAELIVQEHRGNHGKGATTKRGRDLQAVAKRCGDAIWELREQIEVPS